MPIPPDRLEHYRELARQKGVPESSIDATLRWIFNACVSAIDIAWGESPVQQALGKTEQNAVGTLVEHAMILPTIEQLETDGNVPEGAGKDHQDDKR